jgi:hypothetical protein
MDAPKKWRLRFGLRALFLGTALAAVVMATRPVTVKHPMAVRAGMDKEQVLSFCGPPLTISQNAWHYKSTNGMYDVLFGGNERVKSLQETLDGSAFQIRLPKP